MVELYNYAGVLILQQNNVEQNTKIETTQLPTGIYLVRISTEKESVCKKIFVQH